MCSAGASQIVPIVVDPSAVAQDGALAETYESMPLSPETPEVGRPYYRASCKLKSLNLPAEGRIYRGVDPNGIEPSTS